MVDSRDHDLYSAYQRVIREGTPEANEALEKEIAHRKFADELFGTLFADIPADAPENPQDFDCLRRMVRSVEESCGQFSAYSLKYATSLANMCDTQPEKVDSTLENVKEFCASV